MIPRRNKVISRELLSDIKTYLSSPLVRQSDHVEAFTAALKDYFGCQYVVLTASGRKALELIIRSYQLPAGSEIVFPAYTLSDLVPIVRGMGYVPVFADVERDSCNMDPASVEAKITQRTSLIVATHVFGLPCQIEKISRLGRERGVRVIEDCAQAFGASLNGKKLGTFSDAGYFTFEVLKALNTFGGGCIITDDPELYQRARAEVSAHSVDSGKIVSKVTTALLEDAVIHSFIFPLIGWLFYHEATSALIGRLYRGVHTSVRPKNIRYSNFQAYLGCRGLSRVADRNMAMMERRQKFLSLVSNCDGLDFPKSSQAHQPAYYQNLVSTSHDALEMRRELMKRGVDAGVRDEILDDCPFELNDNGSYPVVHELFRTMIQLPLSWHYDDKKMEQIAIALKGAIDVLNRK